MILSIAVFFNINIPIIAINAPTTNIGDTVIAGIYPPITTNATAPNIANVAIGISITFNTFPTILPMKLCPFIPFIYVLISLLNSFSSIFTSKLSTASFITFPCNSSIPFDNFCAIILVASALTNPYNVLFA